MADLLGIPLDQLVVGRTYRIDFDDCCVEGHFNDTLVAIHRDEHGDLDEIEFAHARMATHWSYGSNWWITEDDGDTDQ